MCWNLGARGNVQSGKYRCSREFRSRNRGFQLPEASGIPHLVLTTAPHGLLLLLLPVSHGRTLEVWSPPYNQVLTPQGPSLRPQCKSHLQVDTPAMNLRTETASPQSSACIMGGQGTGNFWTFKSKFRPRSHDSTCRARQNIGRWERGCLLDFLLMWY